MLALEFLDFLLHAVERLAVCSVELFLLGAGLSDGVFKGCKKAQISGRQQG